MGGYNPKHHAAVEALASIVREGGEARMVSAALVLRGQLEPHVRLQLAKVALESLDLDALAELSDLMAIAAAQGRQRARWRLERERANRHG